MEKNKKQEAIEFLSKLEQKLHKIQEALFTPNMSGNTMKVGVDIYTKTVLTPEEAEKLLRVLEENDFVLYPINTCMGFCVGFEIADIRICGQQYQPKRLLTMKEKQLPAGYDFTRLSKIFMRDANRKRAEMLGVKITNNRASYEY